MKKRNIGPIVLLIVIAAGGIAKVAGTVRPVDIVRLTGSGACLGVALVFVIMKFRAVRGE